MIVLKVPYAEKDEAKALGARWNSARKTWYVPDGQAATPFERWVVPHQPGESQQASSPSSKAPSGRVDSYVGKTVVGKFYVELEHDCNPFTACEQCCLALEKAGWIAAHNATKAMLVALGSK
jgi:hypothetical protein